MENQLPQTQISEVPQPTINPTPVPVAKPEEPVYEKPKTNSFLVVLLIVLLLISVSIAGFFAFQTQNLVKELTLLKTIPTPEVIPEPVVTAGPTADWKTYTDKLNRFSFKYPDNVILSKVGNTETLTIDDLVVKINPDGAHQWGEGMPVDEVNKLYMKPYQYPDNPVLKMYPDSAVLFYIEFSSELEKLSHEKQTDVLDQILSTFKFAN